LRESFFIFFQKNTNSKDKSTTVSIDQIFDNIRNLFLEKKFAIPFKSSSLQQDLPKRNPIVFLLDFCPVLI